MMIKTQRRRNCRGTSTLEFIVVLPFLAVNYAGRCGSQSSVVFVYNTVVQAVREGARVVRLPP